MQLHVCPCNRRTLTAIMTMTTMMMITVNQSHTANYTEIW